MHAVLNNYRQSPRKVRRVADLVRGKSVREARLILDALTKRSAAPLAKLLASAVANATHNDKADAGRLRITRISVDKGVVLKRGTPRAQGRSTPIRKHTSIVSIVLGIMEKKQESGIKNKKRHSSILNS